MSFCHHPTTRQVIRWVAPWLSFLALLAWGWRVRDIFNHVTGYGDTLEVLWGMRWYHDSLIVRHTSPLFDPLVFHPYGWHTATLAHSPVFFLLAMPLYEIGGAVFACNILSLASFFVAFAGAFRLARLFTDRFAATVAALAFTFIGMRWVQGTGHLHTLWASSLLPWLAWQLERMRRSEPKIIGKASLVAGLIWGSLINFSLYGLFWGGLVFTLWGRQMLRPRRVGQALVAALVAILVACPSLVPYWLGRQQDQPATFGVEHNMRWGASLNSLVAPNVFHPLGPIRQIARAIYSGPYDESGVANLGLIAIGLAAIGAACATRRQAAHHRRLLWLTLAGLVLALGLLLRWNGQAVSTPAWRTLNAAIWQVGHTFKPGLFASDQPPAPFKKGVPLPGLILTAAFPFWESARTVSRYALLGMLGMTILAGCGLQRLPRPAQYILAAIWLIEILPTPTGNVPLPAQPHPAYAWLAEQPLPDGEGIIDIESPTLKLGGEVLYATQFHQKPTAAGAGSFWPQHTFSLWQSFTYDAQAWAAPETALTLKQYNIRYVLFHMQGAAEQRLWQLASRNPALSAERCFDPAPSDGLWPYPICIAEVLAPVLPINIVRQDGWSEMEEWGLWAEGTESHAVWLAAAPKDHVITIAAFPNCLPTRHQSISIAVNGQAQTTWRWNACEPWQTEILVPGALVRTGRNTLSFKYDYAVRPIDATAGENADPRPLSVGFTRLEVRAGR